MGTLLSQIISNPQDAATRIKSQQKGAMQQALGQPPPMTARLSMAFGRGARLNQRRAPRVGSGSTLSTMYPAQPSAGSLGPAFPGGAVGPAPMSRVQPFGGEDSNPDEYTLPRRPSF